MRNNYLNIFNINQWVIAITLLIPSIFLSQIKYVLSIIDLLFYLLYLFTLLDYNFSSPNEKYLWKRNLIEVIFLIFFNIFHFITGDSIYVSKTFTSIYKFIYLIILIDLSFGFLKLFSKENLGLSRIILFVLLILSFVIPGIGIFYLRRNARVLKT